MKRIVTLLIIGTIVVVCSSCEAKKSEEITYNIDGNAYFEDGDGNIIDGDGNIIDAAPTNAAMASAKE